MVFSALQQIYSNAGVEQRHNYYLGDFILYLVDFGGYLEEVVNLI